jgi:hypothetical protein
MPILHNVCLPFTRLLAHNFKWNEVAASYGMERSEKKSIPSEGDERAKR